MPKIAYKHWFIKFKSMWLVGIGLRVFGLMSHDFAFDLSDKSAR